MKQLTIRGLDDDLHRKLRSRADQQGMSINKYVLSVIKVSVGIANGGVLCDAQFEDLDDLAGTWTQDDYDEFTGELQTQRSIDSELWQ